MKSVGSEPRAAAHFAVLPFDAQLARIAALFHGGAVDSGEEARALLREAGALPDAEPLARLLEALAAHGRLDASLESECVAMLASLPDAALQHLLSRDTTAPIAALLERLAEDALRRWPLERLSALAFVARWLRRRAPSAHERVVAQAEAILDGAPDDGQDARWLLFASGARLAALAADERWSERVREATRLAIDALARAPKSISQANAERLLAQRVYSDPGHFFFELLQNADDAGATRWQVSVLRERVEVRHDGAPFSFLDLVGVLSIGQTTKRADQIGFFGVGFKSVYEVCERPRVHSGVFDLEIAHVSIPRALAERPAHVAGETILVLPYSGQTGADLLHHRALAIPPETLMTLRHARQVEVIGPAGERVSWHLERDDAAMSLRSGADARRYRTRSREVRFAGSREEGRAQQSAVLVAVRLDGASAPVPITGPTIYAFLPTAERSGLRVLVHARFDVTLDRERLTVGSGWNEALLAEAGLGLADLVAMLAREGRDVLPVLSSPGELAPSMAPLSDALRAAVADTPFLPGAAGEMLPPSRARLLEPALGAALAGVDLGGGDRALAALAARERAVAASLGARSFDAADLAALLVARLVAGERAPGWLGSVVLEALSTAALDDDALRALPLLVDASGVLVAAASTLVAPPRWAALYAGQRSIVTTSAADAVPPALRARLALPTLDPSLLVRDLRDDALRAALIGKGELLFEVLAELPDAHLAQLADLPLVRALGAPQGSLHAAANVVHLDAMLAPLADVLASDLAVLDPALAARHPSLVARWISRCGLGELAARIDSGPSLATPLLSAPSLEALRALLDVLAPTLARDLARRLAGLAIFPDRHGARRPLLGAGRALRPARELAAVLPEWPWLAEPERPFVEAAGAPEVDARAIASALAAPHAAPSATLPIVPPSRLAAVELWLAPRGGELPSALVDALASAPIWLDAQGEPRPLDALRRGTPSDALDALYRALGGRWVASREAMELARALRVDGRLPASDHAALIADLLRAGVAPGVPRALLASVLGEACAALPPHAVAPIAGVPMFLDEAGVPRPLGSWSAPDARACHRPGPFRALLRSGRWPLLAEADEALFAAVLAIAAPAEATPADVLRDVASLADAPDALAAFLDAHSGALDAGSRAALGRLPIFASGTGARRAAHELSSRAMLERALGSATLAALAIDDALVASPEEEARIARLGLALRPPDALITERMLPSLVSGAPLAEQPAPWASIEALAALALLAAGNGIDVRTAPLAVDAAQRVVGGPLYVASDAERRLVAALPLAAKLSDPTWAAAHALALPGSPLLEALGARAIAEALRDACRAEAPREAHEIIRDPSALYAWLRDSGAVIAADEVARSALAIAAVLPSQRGTLRAPRELVLDPALPDLGLGWGLAGDVPPDVGGWLRATFEIDRHARRALVAQLLDGLDAAAAEDDRPRAADLTAFLARTLGAGDVAVAELEERARRLDVRARLKVPLVGGGWQKPRFAWSPSDGVAAQAETFALDLPPRIALGELDAPSRILLAACGAKDDLDDDAILGCLEGRGLREGAAARRALARYVALRALATPARADRWMLAGRAWVPSRGGALRRPRDLVWPDALARALFGEASERFPDPEVISDLEPRAAARLGFARAEALSIAAVAEHQGDREARPALLTWLEEGLVSRRFATGEVRAAFRARLRLRDDEGTPRPIGELARNGARALFGARRGDWTASRDFPRVAHALDVPPEPDGAMIVAFLVEVGESSLDARERDAVLARLPECLERFGAEARGGQPARLPPGAAIAVLRGGRLELARIGDPGVRMLEPAALVDALEPDVLDAMSDPMPIAREAGLRRKLLASGVPDLWSALDVVAVIPGPRRAELDAAAERLRAGLAAVLGDAVGRHARTHDALAVRGTLELAPVGSGYRGARAGDITLPVDACVHEGTLLLTPLVLDEPARLAAALAREPERRAALAEWLEAGEREGRWERGRAPTKVDAPGPAIEQGLVSRIRRFFGGAAPIAPLREDRPAKEPSPPESSRARDEQFFRRSADLESQLDRAEGWMESRRETPDFGFAFVPPRIEAPWLYAPKLVASRFDRRGQRWEAATLRRPEPRGDAGTIAMRGRLPAGEVILPVPLYGRVSELRCGRGEAEARTDATGVTALRLEEATEVRMRVSLGQVPDLDRARPMRGAADALTSFVPDVDLPDETRAVVADLDDDDAPIARALALRDFVRERYRYDPSYLEDASIGRWLARVTQGRANVHVSALHAAGDATHLGAGVCYELNVLACELLRRAGIPAVLATGWVLDGGTLSAPDHLWAIALFEDEAGAPVWVPIDASTTREGRPLRVPQKAPGRFRAPRDPEVKAPAAVRWDLGPRGGGARGASEGGARGASEGGARGRASGGGARGGASGGGKPKRDKAPPRVELTKVLHHLGQLAGRPLDERERADVERALSDPLAAAALLDRLRAR